MRPALVALTGWMLMLVPHAQSQELMTRWGRELAADREAIPLNDYPRPALVRDRWLNLNGWWDFGVRARAVPSPGTLQERIRVPFCVESSLSGVTRAVKPDERAWYRRTFRLPADWSGSRILLHFGAVDFETEVWVNGIRQGTHRGGYDPFSFDITVALRPGNENEILVGVWDPTDQGPFPRGKQVLDPQGIWYTAVTGIWQTVWLEPVPMSAIGGLRVSTDGAAGVIRVEPVLITPQRGDRVIVRVRSEDREVASGRPTLAEPAVRLTIPSPRLWSPDDPYLYDIVATLERDGQVIDRVTSYAGLRSIALADGPHGRTIHLNGKPLFQIGPLDQGWWPDGLYTAPSDEALEFDVKTMKDLGFNMVRKHVKVEPQRWYYHCDRLGLLVWQDMPSGDTYAPPVGPGDPRAQVTRSRESAAQFEAELRAMVRSLWHHPSIVVWVPFNEGWGQFQTAEIAAMVQSLDPSRLVDSASGWNDMGVGHMHDIHSYPGPSMPPLEPTRAAVLGEFGGLGLPIFGHLWKEDDRNWGYRSYDSLRDLSQAYEALFFQLHLLVPRGLSAAVYTQLTDVESEVNGLMTYDREVLKVDTLTTRAAHQRLHRPAPQYRSIVDTCEEQPQPWRFVTSEPSDEWTRPEFDDASWTRAPGGFGTPQTPGAVVATRWDGSDIWLRRTVTIQTLPDRLALRIHHDEDAEVFINGVPVASLSGYTTSYATIPLAPDALSALKPGDNVLAIHCRQTDGGQFIDCGLGALEEP